MVATMLNRSGMALVLALMAISLLVAITVQLFTQVNWQMQASSNFRDSVSLDALNRSAINIARAALLADQNTNKFDSQHDDWNFLSDKELHTLLGSDKLTVNVSDLSGKLQVNALVSQEKDNNKRNQQEQLQYELWLRFLTSGRFAVEDEIEAGNLIDAIRDWLDADENVRDHGAEEGHYLALAQPYTPRNGPIQSLEELLLVRGMTDDIFYGNEDYPGIIEYLTDYGADGTININSASAQVLQAMAPGLDEEMVQDFIAFRQNEENKEKLANPQWYRQVTSIPGDIELDKELATVTSSYFSIASTVEMKGLSRTGRAIVYREENGAQKLLRWDVE